AGATGDRRLPNFHLSNLLIPTMAQAMEGGTA
ncbi:MAG: hypothetical protein ACI90E_001874, partial [Yoonia sp.]